MRNFSDEDVSRIRKNKGFVKIDSVDDSKKVLDAVRDNLTLYFSNSAKVQQDGVKHLTTVVEKNVKQLADFIANKKVKKKAFKFTVNRDAKGRISTVDVREI